MAPCSSVCVCVSLFANLVYSTNWIFSMHAPQPHRHIFLKYTSGRPGVTRIPGERSERRLCAPWAHRGCCCSRVRLHDGRRLAASLSTSRRRAPTPATAALHFPCARLRPRTQNRGRIKQKFEIIVFTLLFTLGKHNYI